MKKREVVLSIAGSDPSGGAGIQQDLKVLTVLQVYGCAAITALTVQNTMGVQAVYPVPGEVLRGQVQAVLEDIRPQAVKIGMLSTAENVEVVAGILSGYRDVFVVADPVILSKNGKKLLDDEAVSIYMERLLPVVDLLTPNIPECVRLTGISTEESEFPQRAVRRLFSMMEKNRLSNKGPTVLLKGGHGGSKISCADVLFSQGEFRVFESTRLANPHTHGTGCSLSSAIAAFIAKGDPVIKAVEEARHFVLGAIEAGFPLGKGIGPVDPMVFLK